MLTNTYVSKTCEALANGSSANIKFSKTQLSNMVQLGGFLGKLLRPLIKTSLPLMKYVLKPLTKSVLVPLEFTAVASAQILLFKGKSLDRGSFGLSFANNNITNFY